jgi:DNA-directed RNA polymerase specialized sigma24 family protein
MPWCCVTDRTTPLTAADESFVAFVESAWQRHLRLAVLLTGHRSQAEELLQDSLVRMYERWRKLSRRDDLHAYLRRALVNNHTSVWRRRRRESLVAEARCGQGGRADRDRRAGQRRRADVRRRRRAHGDHRERRDAVPGRHEHRPDGRTDGPVALPRWTVRFSPNVDQSNAVRAGAVHAVPIVVTPQPDADTGTLAKVSPPQGNGFVSLRATAADSKGNTVTQTVVRAYRYGRS